MCPLDAYAEIGLKSRPPYLKLNMSLTFHWLVKSYQRGKKSTLFSTCWFIYNICVGVCVWHVYIYMYNHNLSFYKKEMFSLLQKCRPWSHLIKFHVVDLISVDLLSKICQRFHFYLCIWIMYVLTDFSLFFRDMQQKCHLAVSTHLGK